MLTALTLGSRDFELDAQIRGGWNRKKSHDNHSHVVHVRVACAVHIIGMLINCVAANLGASPHGS